MSGWSNDQEEMDSLKGARILGVTRREDEFDRRTYWTLHVRYRPGLHVNGAKEGFYELWQDEEGNGPGYFALVSNGEEVAA